MVRTLFAFAAASALTLLAETTTVPEGGALTLTSSYNKDGNAIVAAAGSTITLPKGSGAVAFYPHLIVSGGVVRVTCASGSSYTRYRFVSGLRAVEGGSLVIDGAPEISVDRATINTSTMLMPATGPVCDIGDVTFTDPNPKGLLLRLKSTVRKLPTTCPVNIESDATVALACQTDADSAPIRDGNAFAVDRFDAIALTANALPVGCHVMVSPGRSFSFKPAALAADGLSWTAVGSATGRYDIELLGKGAAVTFANAGGQSMRCVSNVRGVGEIRFKPDSGTPYTRFRGLTYRAASNTALVIPVDDAAYPVAPASVAWQDKVSHWFDASDESSFVYFTFDPNAEFGWSGAKNEYDGHPLVIGMTDQVAGSEYALYNSRLWDKVSGNDYSGMKSDYNLQVLPYPVEDGLNGLTYLCCGTRGETKANAKYDASGNLASAGEGRRLRVWSGDVSGATKPSGSYSGFPAAYCIMVFGSQQGGGAAILGAGTGTAERSSAFVRDGITTTSAWMKSDSYQMHVDGNLVTTTLNTNPNGGWQIVSIDMSGTDAPVTGLGNEFFGNSLCGGQNYAEAIFFAEKPTVEERTACERYLAEKWGLMCTQWDVPYVMPSGTAGTVFLGNQTSSGYAELSGGPAEIYARGVYSGNGKIDIPAGRTLVLDRPLPPTEADVPEANRAGWFDPDFAGAALSTSELPHSDLLWTLYGRTLTGLCDGENDIMYASGGQSGKTMDEAKTKNFAPRMVRGIRGPLTYGPSRNWLVFAENYSDGLGNAIRSKRVGAGALSAGYGYPSITQAFFVTDTSGGGGSIVSDTVNFDGQIKPRAVSAPVADPIWASGNSVAITNTCLDTTEVDGFKAGYSGRPEVLSFITETGFRPSYVVWYQGGNTEILGEFIFYSTPLSKEERTKVQEYLMYKWFGDLAGKYADYTGATVQGEGTVKSATLRNLPKFAPSTGEPSFTGHVTGGESLAFTIDPAASAAAATDAIAVGAPLVLGADAAVTARLATPSASGRFLLLSAPSISGTARLEVLGNTRNRRVSLSIAGGEMWLDVAPRGMMISLR